MMGVLGHLGFLFRLRPCARIKPGWDPVIDGIVTDRYEAILTPYKSCTGLGYICVTSLIVKLPNALGLLLIAICISDILLK